MVLVNFRKMIRTFELGTQMTEIDQFLKIIFRELIGTELGILFWYHMFFFLRKKKICNFIFTKFFS